jgi:hypothetical protein
MILKGKPILRSVQKILLFLTVILLTFQHMPNLLFALALAGALAVYGLIGLVSNISSTFRKINKLNTKYLFIDIISLALSVIIVYYCLILSLFKGVKMSN